jgi:hypothetical protein
VAINAIPMKYRGENFRSSLEADWAATFESLDMHWTYEAEGLQVDRKVNYLPDFWLPTQRVFAEVKSPTNERMHKPHQMQRAFHRAHEDISLAYTCPLVVILRPAEKGTAMWEGALDEQQPVIVLCPSCQHFGFMDFNGPWRCRRQCVNTRNKFWTLPGGDIFWPGEITFVRAPRSGR